MNSEEIVLIVDDDLDLRILVERFVSSAGYQYISVENGAKAIEVIRNHTISVVVTDMMMPEMNGLEMLINAKKIQPDIDVIVMTGYCKLCSFIDVIKAGATDFLTKPFNIDEFTAKLERVFGERFLLKELKESKEKLETDNKAKEAFFSIASHELETLKESLRGLTELSGMTDRPPKETEYMNMVVQSADRLFKLTNLFVDTSAIEKGEIS